VTSDASPSLPEAAILPPGSVIGIVGGGQLGRMLALAAANLGLKTHIFTPEHDAPALQVSDAATLGDYEDSAKLAAFADKVDIVTYEFENIPADSVTLLANAKPVAPPPAALAVSQDRLDEKRFLDGLGCAVAPFHPIDSLADLRAASAHQGGHGVLKTRRFGYDGKGQWRIAPETELEAIFDALSGRPAILEGLIAFEREVSVIVARAANGTQAIYEPIENSHENHILRHSAIPANLTQDHAAQAADMAAKIVDALDYVGVLAIEFFVTQNGMMVNEIAPRVHNSGHLTADACFCGQFEQHIRAIAGWPLGNPSAHSHAVMTNLLGDEVADWADLARQGNAKLHLYGKQDAKPGRKMGHVTRLTAKNPA